jgi:uncharacterized RDD family membrane protein YckC
MATGMKYFLRTPEDKEYGPIDQETLVQWAQAGRISPGSQLRNTLMSNWSAVTDIAFLKDILPDEVPVDQGIGGKLSSIVKKDGHKLAGAFKGLHTSGKFQFTPASTGLRFGAWVIDAAVLFVGLFFILLLVAVANANATETYPIFYTTTIVVAGFFVLYYTITIGFLAQTIGQRFFGIMVVCKDGDPVLMGRALMFTLFYYIFWSTTLVFTFVLPSKRAIQDMLSGVRVVRIAVKD